MPRPSIRNQILIPLVALQGVATLAAALMTAALATQRSATQIQERLQGVRNAMDGANFPMNASVLLRMRELSGAELVTLDATGRILTSTLSAAFELPVMQASAKLDVHEDHDESLAQIRALLPIWDAMPILTVGGTRYYAVRTRLGVGGGRKETWLLILYPEQRWRQARWEAAWPALAWGGGALLLMVLVTRWIADRLGARIRGVEALVRRLAMSDLDANSRAITQDHPPNHGDEMDALVDSARRLDQDRADLRATVARIEHARILGRLAAGFAHQARNALTGARLSIQLHARRCSSGNRDQSLQVALRQLTIMEEYVQGLLALGADEDSLKTLDPVASVDCTVLIREIADLIGPNAAHARVQLDVKIPEDGCSQETVVGSASRLRAALLNVTLNAVEAAGAGGRVTLALHPEAADCIVFEVADTGPGVPPDVARRLGEPFLTTKPEGVGLGLALAFQVAREHCGTLSQHRRTGVLDRNAVMPEVMTVFQLTIPRNSPRGEFVKD